MSRIGKKIIRIPDGVDVKVNNNLITIKGPKGELSRELISEISAEVKENNLLINLKKNKKGDSALWGTNQALINNMILGVSKGFEKKLLFEGVGYKAAVNGNKLVLSLGFSHPVEIEAPKGIEFKVEKNAIIVSGTDKHLVGQISANIRLKRKVEPYKGKGIRYEKEIVRRKAGKKAVSSA
ncbi:MAG: 50S ribosomal protein L6 [bacterium]|nr:50S ribosomal protein L6 [bacterium]